MRKAKPINYTITPAELLAAAYVDPRDLKFRGGYIKLRYCPFCRGGRSAEQFTLGVHEEKGFFACCRSKCGEKGNFWTLLEHFGVDPRGYIKRGNKETYGK